MIKDIKTIEEAINIIDEKQSIIDNYKMMLDNTHFGLAITKMNGEILEINSTYYTIFGYDSAEEFSKVSAESYYYNPEDRKKLIEELENNFKVRNFVAPYIHKNGHIIWLSFNSLMINENEDETLIFHTFEDVTHKRSMTQELLVKNQALESSISAFGMANLDGKVTYVNPAYIKMWGHDSVDDIVGKDIGNELGDPEQQEFLMKEIQEKGSYEGELVGRKKDGSKFNFYAFLALLADKQGKPMGLTASFLDITERKRTEKDLEMKEHALNSSMSAIAVLSLEGLITYANSAFLKLWGFEKEEDVIGKSPTSFVKDETRADALMKHVVEQGSWKGELDSRRIDGTPMWIAITISRILDQSDNLVGFITAIEDISDRREAEDILKQSTVTRDLVGVMFQDLKSGGGLTDRDVYLVGEKLAKGIEVNTIEDYIHAFKNMGLGELRLQNSDEEKGRWTFTGKSLVEHHLNSSRPTDNYALGFLCGAVSNVIKETNVVGVEIDCQSMGDEYCKFVIQRK